MKNTGFTIATILLLGALCAGGYFAITGLTEPASYITMNRETIGDLHQVVTTNDTPSPSPAEPVATTTPASSGAVVTSSTPTAANSLESRIQKLIDQKVTLKVGSKGANVGTVQEFMNLYFKKSLKIDNDFGKTLESNVKTFQTQNKVSATGQVGPATLGKMKEWLAKQ